MQQLPTYLNDLELRSFFMKGALLFKHKAQGFKDTEAHTWENMDRILQLDQWREGLELLALSVRRDGSRLDRLPTMNHQGWHLRFWFSRLISEIETWHMWNQPTADWVVQLANVLKDVEV